MVKASAYNAGDLGLIPGSGRSPGEGNGNPLQYSCLENPMDGEAWQAPIYGFSKSRTRLSNGKTSSRFGQKLGGEPGIIVLAMLKKIITGLSQLHRLGKDLVLNFSSGLQIHIPTSLQLCIKTGLLKSTCQSCNLAFKPELSAVFPIQINYC